METRIYEDLADLYKLWRDTCLGEIESEQRETNFLEQILKQYKDIKSIIDLGGGIGLHSHILSENGFDVTLFDRSKKALSIAKKSTPLLKTVLGSFETINLGDIFDASVCMWSTLSYVPKGKSQEHFYSWIAAHTRSVIVLDEPNFSIYPPIFHKIYEGEDTKNRLKIARDWRMEGNLKVTDFLYEVTNKATGEVGEFKDGEIQQYLTQTELETLLGDKWELEKIYGAYNLEDIFDSRNSARMIFVFVRTIESL